jgi:hypothetical protein
MLLSMVSIVPIHHHVALLVTNLLELYIGNGSGGQLAEGDMLEPRRVVKQILKAVERQFPAELDTAVTSWLERTQEEDGTGVKEGPRMQALRDIFYGSLHMPLADSNTSLYLSVDHPEVDYMVLILLCILPLVDNYAYFCDLPWNSLDAEPYMLVFHLIDIWGFSFSWHSSADWVLLSSLGTHHTQSYPSDGNCCDCVSFFIG